MCAMCVLAGVLFGHDFVGLVFKRVGWLFLIDGRVMYDVLSHRIFCRRVLILYQTKTYIFCRDLISF